MVTRNSTAIFILMRDNAVRHRSFYVDQKPDDRASLIQRQSNRELESIGSESIVIPDVVQGYEEMQYDFDRIKIRMNELVQLHNIYLNRPSFDDTASEERRIQEMTKQLTEALSRCHRKLKTIDGSQQGKFSSNVHQSLARSLHDMSNQFRASQTKYLRKLKSREEESIFQVDPNPSADDDGLSEFIDRNFTLQLVEDNSALVQQREQEINSVVKSINELNEIFADVAQLVVEQGEVIDRIDYNIEAVQSNVRGGYEQLKKAEKYHKKNRKMLIIFVLAGLVVLLTIILVFTKLNRR